MKLRPTDVLLALSNLRGGARQSLGLDVAILQMAQLAANDDTKGEFVRVEPDITGTDDAWALGVAYLELLGRSVTSLPVLDDLKFPDNFDKCAEIDLQKEFYDTMLQRTVFDEKAPVKTRVYMQEALQGLLASDASDRITATEAQEWFARMSDGIDITEGVAKVPDLSIDSGYELSIDSTLIDLVDGFGKHKTNIKTARSFRELWDSSRLFDDVEKRLLKDPLEILLQYGDYNRRVRLRQPKLIEYDIEVIEKLHSAVRDILQNKTFKYTVEDRHAISMRDGLMLQTLEALCDITLANCAGEYRQAEERRGLFVSSATKQELSVADAKSGRHKEIYRAGF